MTNTQNVISCCLVQQHWQTIKNYLGKAKLEKNCKSLVGHKKITLMDSMMVDEILRR